MFIKKFSFLFFIYCLSSPFVAKASYPVDQDISGQAAFYDYYYYSEDSFEEQSDVSPDVVPLASKDKPVTTPPMPWFNDMPLAIGEEELFIAPNEDTVSYPVDEAQAIEIDSEEMMWN